MRDRYGLADAEWVWLEALLLDGVPCRGGRWLGHRLVVSGVLWRGPARECPGGVCGVLGELEDGVLAALSLAG